MLMLFWNHHEHVDVTLKSCQKIGRVNWLLEMAQYVCAKETTLERADFTLQLLMFLTEEKERRMFTIFFSLQFLSAVVPRDSSKDRLSASRPRKLRPTGLEGSSF